MIESELQRVYNYPIYPEDSKKFTQEGFVNTDNGTIAGYHWTTFYVRKNKVFYFDSFGDSLDKYFFDQLPKPASCHNEKTHDINSRLFGTYCLYFFYLIGRMKHCDDTLKMPFG